MTSYNVVLQTALQFVAHFQVFFLLEDVMQIHALLSHLCFCIVYDMFHKRRIHAMSVEKRKALIQNSAF